MSPISVFTTRRARYTLLGAAVLSTSLLARSLVAPATHASLGYCGSDPIVALSNGYKLDLSATVSDTPDDVQQVAYTLHIPVGTWVTSEIDPAVLDPKDTFQFYADEPAGTYSATVKVSTATPKMPVSATTDLVTVTGSVLTTASDSGQSPQMLQMQLAG